jgi:hypothetical protein
MYVGKTGRRQILGNMYESPKDLVEPCAEFGLEPVQIDTE